MVREVVGDQNVTKGIQMLGNRKKIETDFNEYMSNVAMGILSKLKHTDAR